MHVSATLIRMFQPVNLHHNNILTVPLYIDVAISAPFGNDPLVSGTVYIYRGSLQGMIRQPSQTIVGSNLNLLSDKLAHLTSFGAYLSGSTDIDGNTYNGI